MYNCYRRRPREGDSSFLAEATKISVDDSLAYSTGSDLDGFGENLGGIEEGDEDSSSFDDEDAGGFLTSPTEKKGFVVSISNLDGELEGNTLRD